jgi:molybdopterin-guanine dinucleotide biosynthesis protein A
LVQTVASAVRLAAGSAVLVGPARIAEAAGLPGIPDLYPGEGPLGGILTALAHTAADFNLIAACDMPELDAVFLLTLLNTAEQAGADALLPAGPSGLMEPLCAVYHRRSADALAPVFARGVRKIAAALDAAGLRLVTQPVPEVSHFKNVNTPEEWAPYGR